MSSLNQIHDAQKLEQIVRASVRFRFIKMTNYNRHTLKLAHSESFIRYIYLAMIATG